ncbi:MAG: ATP-grasp domain-containing protein [Bacteroidales bacterium]
MIILDKPYVSNILLDTVERNQFPTIPTPLIEAQAKDRNLHYLSNEQAVEAFRKDPETRMYSNSENAINWIETHLGFTPLPARIKRFKNKVTFREMIQERFPDFFFKQVALKDLDKINPTTLPYPFIIKPAIGFFSMGVYKVDAPEEWTDVLNSINNELEEVKNLYPAEVFDANDFIIEECIEGEEYAVDCYFNEEGEPVVMNILNHIFSSGKDVSDRVYYTSKEIILRMLPKVQDLVNYLGEVADLRNFPIHLELRENSKGELIPIEVNPMRFGGWCTSADLGYHAYGINQYEYYFANKKPNWDEILAGKDGKNYCIAILDNNSGIPGEEVDQFDYEKLAEDFVRPLEIRRVDFKEYPVFGFVFTETPANKMEEIYRILGSNLREYILQETEACC